MTILPKSFLPYALAAATSLHGQGPTANLSASASKLLAPHDIRWSGENWNIQTGSVAVPGIGRTLAISSDRRSARFRVEQDRRWRRNGGSGGTDNLKQRRSELSSVGSLRYDSSYWFAYSYKIDAWNGRDSCALGQVSTRSQRDSPILALRLIEGRRLAVTTRAVDETGVGEYVYRGDAGRNNVAHDVVYNVTYGSSDASLRIWLDGQLVVSKTRLRSIGGVAAGAPYFKIGVYCSQGVTEPVMVTFQNYAGHGSRSLEDRVLRSPSLSLRPRFYDLVGNVRGAFNDRMSTGSKQPDGS